MELDQLIPERVKWEPKYKDENDVEHQLEFYFRPFTLNDEAWLKRTFGDKLQEIFEQLQMDKVCQIAFHQLEVSSKKKIMGIAFKDIDEDGNEIEVALKGGEKLGFFVQGLPDQLELTKMLLRTKGISQPILDRVGKLIEEGKV